MLDCARRERPDLVVVAELFTNDEALDADIAARLGLSALVRESLHAASPATTRALLPPSPSRSDCPPR